LQGDLTGPSGLPIMEFMQDVTFDSHIKQNWKWSLWLHETYSKRTRACLAGLTSTPLSQGHHIDIWTSQLQNIAQCYPYAYVCSEHQAAGVCFTICIV